MSASWKKSCCCLQPGSSAIAATAQALQRRLCMCFHPFPYHSQSTFLEINSGTCWWMQVLFRNMTTCHHPVSCYQATAGNICLLWNVFCTVLPSKVCPLSSPCQKSSVCRLWEWKFFFLILENFMVVVEDLHAVRMAEDSSVDSDLPDCNCDITRQAAIFVCFWLILFFLKSWLAGKLTEILICRNQYCS